MRLNSLSTYSWEFHIMVLSGSQLEEVEGFISQEFQKINIEKVLFVVPPDGDSTLFNYASAKRGRYPNYLLFKKL
jgi:hypothetical protein